jgi:hypothetical protein
MDLEFRPIPKPSHNRRVKKRGDRNKFTKYVRDQVKEHFNHTCQECELQRNPYVTMYARRSRGKAGGFSLTLYCSVMQVP